MKNKKRIIFIIVALIFFIVCIIFAIKKIYDIWGVKEIKGSGNPDIYKIVSLETKSLSEESETEFFPKYIIYLELKDDRKILELELQTGYVFGKDLTPIYEDTLRFDSSSDEIRKINSKEECCIVITLDPLKLETPEPGYPTSLRDDIPKDFLGFPNEERFYVGFSYLKYI